MENLTLGQMERMLKIYDGLTTSKYTFDELEKAKEEYKQKDATVKEFLKTKTLDETVEVMLNLENLLKEKRVIMSESPEERRAELSNQILYYAQANRMSMKDITDSIEYVKDYFYTDALMGEI